MERYNKLKILSESAVHQIGQTRLASSLPSPLPKLLYNRPVYLVTTIGKNYLRYFTPAFFNQSFGAQSQFAIPGKNMLTLPGMILFYLGLALAIVRCRGDKPLQFILAWLALAPLAASLTADPPQALRPIPMILPIIALISLAIIRLSRFHRYLFPAIILLYGLFSMNYFYDYFSNYSKNYSASWQYGMEQAIGYLNEHRGEYSKVFITKRYGEPHLFYAFYSRLDPNIIQSPSKTIRFHQSDWYWTDKIENTYFVNDWDILTSSTNRLKLESGQYISTSNSLLITSFDHVPINSHLLKTIDFLDGKPALKIVSLP